MGSGTVGPRTLLKLSWVSHFPLRASDPCEPRESVLFLFLFELLRDEGQVPKTSFMKNKKLHIGLVFCSFLGFCLLILFCTRYQNQDLTQALPLVCISSLLAS